jgi:hypothetical protein
VHAVVDALSGGLFAKSLPRYSHAILNPPYKKMALLKIEWVTGIFRGRFPLCKCRG